jgi:hypothetical protein
VARHGAKPPSATCRLGTSPSRASPPVLGAAESRQWRRARPWPRSCGTPLTPRPQAGRCTAAHGHPTSRAQPLCPGACARADRAAPTARPSTRGPRAEMGSTFPSLGSARGRGSTSVPGCHIRNPLVYFDAPHTRYRSSSAFFIDIDRNTFTYRIRVILLFQGGEKRDETSKILFLLKHAE